MKTRILAMLLALAMIVTVFAACGGDEEIITVDIKRLGDNEREISVERGEG